MGKHLSRILGPLGILIVIIFIIGYRGGAFGVPLDKLQSFSRQHQPIPEEWLCIEEVKGDVATLLFYPEDQSNACYVIYMKGNGLSFGYHSRSRGFMYSIQEGICEYRYADKNVTVFLSLNQPDVRFAELTHEDGTKETLVLDAGEPFAMIVPIETTVVFHDAEGPIDESVRAVVAI